MPRNKQAGSIVIVLVVAFLIGWAVWQGGGQSDTETGPIKIGVTMPLTGEAASFGSSGMTGFNVALEEINSAGGVNGRQLELVVEDDKCGKDGSTTINKLVNLDRVAAIIGPICSAAAGPGLPIAQREKTPVIFWGSAPPLTKIGDYLFRTYPSDSMQGKFAAEFIYNKLGKKRAAVLYVKNDWGQGLRDVFVDHFQSLGGEVVYDDGFIQDVKDMRTVVVKAKATDPDVVYFPAYPAAGIVGLRQMKEAGLAVPVVGGDAFADDSVLQASAAEGVLFTQGVIANPDEFVAKVKASQGEDADSSWLTPLAYDALHIFADVMGRVGTNKQAVRDALANLSYDKGVSLAKIEFDENGDLKEANFEVRVIKKGKSVLYQE